MEAFRMGKHTLPSLCCRLLLPVNIIAINYLLSACQPSEHRSWLVVTLKGQSAKMTEKHIFFSCFLLAQVWWYKFLRFLSLWRWMEFCLWCTENWELLPEQMSTFVIGLPWHLETISPTKSKGNSKARWLWGVTRVVFRCTKHRTWDQDLHPKWYESGWDNKSTLARFSRCINAYKKSLMYVWCGKGIINTLKPNCYGNSSAWRFKSRILCPHLYIAVSPGQRLD